MAGRDIGGYVEKAKKLVREKLTLPPGYVLQWSGQYENMIRVSQRLKVVVPLPSWLTVPLPEMAPDRVVLLVWLKLIVPVMSVAPDTVRLR